MLWKLTNGVESVKNMGTGLRISRTFPNFCNASACKGAANEFSVKQRRQTERLHGSAFSYGAKTFTELRPGDPFFRPD